jgi:hypothetical protein
VTRRSQRRSEPLGIVDELDGAPLEEGQPGKVTIGAAVEELDRPGSSTPLGRDGALAFGGLGTTVAEATDGAEDRPAGGQLVVRAVAVDPCVMIPTARVDELGQDGIVGIDRHRIMMPSGIRASFRSRGRARIRSARLGPWWACRLER